MVCIACNKNRANKKFVGVQLLLFKNEFDNLCTDIGLPCTWWTLNQSNIVLKSISKCISLAFIKSIILNKLSKLISIVGGIPDLRGLVDGWLSSDNHSFKWKLSYGLKAFKYMIICFIITFRFNYCKLFIH